MEFEEVVSSALAADSAGWRELVVNDWGILDELSGRVNARLTAGRLLLRLRRGPGRFEDQAGNDEAARRYFAWGPLYDSQFLALLREQGIVRLELDPPRRWEPLPAADGLALSMHLDNRLVSVTAACPFRDGGEIKSLENTGSCGHDCLDHGPVVMRSDRLSKPLLQFGKEVLEPCGGELDEEQLPESVDHLITSDFGTKSA
jgi:hypothetical protein